MPPPAGAGPSWAKVDGEKAMTEKAIVAQTDVTRKDKCMKRPSSGAIGANHEFTTESEHLDCEV
jgi:hypothetical protein